MSKQAFDRLFGLAGAPDEYTEFDTAALLRSDQKDRIEALARGVQTGIYAPNEARNQEGLDSVPFGDEPRTQAQNVPLSAISSIPSAPASAVPVSAPAVKDYRRVVRRDVKALNARANGKTNELDGAELIRKTKANG